MTKTNPQDGKRYDAETHQWVVVSEDALPAEKKVQPTAAKSEPDTPAAQDIKE